MKSFLQRFGSLVSGVLHGFDRLRLRGSKRQLCNPGGFFSFLSHLQVPLQHYKSYAKDTTLSLCKAIETSGQASRSVSVSEQQPGEQGRNGVTHGS